jgi:DNA-binding NarL/FixJ family response regulator
MNPNATPVVLVDPDNLSRSALELLFSDENRFELVRSVRHTSLLPETSREVVVIIEPSERGTFQQSALLMARSLVPQGRLVVYTSGFDTGTLGAALAVRVSGYLIKGRIDDTGLASIVELVAQSQTIVLDERIRELFESQPWRLSLGPPSSLLTPLANQERAVLHLLSSGLHDEEIGQRLSIRVTTVRTHVQRAEAKLGAQHRAHAVALATRYGLIDPLTAV